MVKVLILMPMETRMSVIGRMAIFMVEGLILFPIETSI